MKSDIYQRAIDAFGVEKQAKKCCEECAELIVAIHHWQDRKVTYLDLAHEIADTMIMCRQMSLFMPKGMVDEIIQMKLERLDNLIKLKEGTNGYAVL